jgi:hypothetical protein
MRKVESINKHFLDGMEIFPQRHEDGSLSVWANLISIDGGFVKVDILPALPDDEFELLHNIF